MNDIVYTKSYEDYKAEVGSELSKASESFVKIGYLLKVARDTEVLNGTEYEGNYLKFAENEFGLEKTQVSRFIRINDKFSIDGNSTELLEQYKGFGTRKLGVMLLIPDSINEELSPDMTVEEIEEIKEEIKEENKISPLEAYAEQIENENFKNVAADHYEHNMLAGALYQILEESPELYEQIAKEPERSIKIMAPVAEQTYLSRIKGVGRVMVIFHESEIAVINARTAEKTFFSFKDCQEAIAGMLLPEGTAAEKYERTFGKPFPQKEAPKEQKKEEQKKAEKKVKVTNSAKKDEPKKNHSVEHKEVGGRTEAEERSNQTAADNTDSGEEVHDIQPEGTEGENPVLGEENQSGTEGEQIPFRTFEALPCEGAGTAGGEGNTAGTSERNKYSGRLEQLEHDVSILTKEIDGKDKGGIAGANWREDALKTAQMIRECIQTIIKDLEEEEGPSWREIK